METGLPALLRQSQCEEDVKFIEKIISQIAISQNHDFWNSFMMCYQLLLDIPMSISMRESIVLMKKMLGDLARTQRFQVGELWKMFKLGSDEMNRTSVKYNRYIRFAMNHLQLIPEYPGHSTFNSVFHAQSTLGWVWNHLYSSEFIDDYLRVQPLREYGLIVMKPLRMIIDAAMQHNKTWNKQYLHLIANHSKLFFDIEHIITEATRHRQTNEKNMVYLIDYFVNRGLIEWKALIPILSRYFNETGESIYRTLLIQAYNRTLMELAHPTWKRNKTNCGRRLSIVDGKEVYLV